MHSQPNKFRYDKNALTIRPGVWFILIVGLLICTVMEKFHTKCDNAQIQSVTLVTRETQKQSENVSNPIAARFSLPMTQADDPDPNPIELLAIQQRTEDRRTWIDDPQRGF